MLECARLCVSVTGLPGRALRVQSRQSLSHTCCRSPVRAGRLLLQTTPTLDHCFRGHGSPWGCPVSPATVCFPRAPCSSQRVPVSTHLTQSENLSSPRPTRPCAPCLVPLSRPSPSPRSPSLTRLRLPCLLPTYIRRRLPRASSGSWHWLFPLPGMLFPDTRTAPPSPPP